MADFKDILAWQKAMDLVAAVYDLARKIPGMEDYQLTNNIKRTVLSIPARIANGRKRQNDYEFHRFLGAARGATGELETFLLICVKLEFLKNEELEPVIKLLNETGKMITGLMKTLDISQ